MIQKMKKITFLVYHREYDKFLTELQRLGVLHIQPSADQTAAQPAKLRQLEEQLQHTLVVKRTFIQLLKCNPDTIQPGTDEGAEQYVAREDELQENIRLATLKAKDYSHDAKILKPWGDFDRTEIERRLAAAGISIHYHSAPRKHFEKALSEYESNVISSDKKYIYFVTFTLQGEEDVVDAMTLQLPDEPLHEAERLAVHYASELERLKAERLANAAHVGDVEALENALNNQIAFERAQLDSASAAQGKVMVVEGWFPVPQEQAVEAFLKQADTYYEIRTPLPTDNVPIKFNNDGFSRMFERLTKMYGFPSYNEWDPTPILAPFFTLFFAICMGDAGYGVLITLFGLLDMAGKSRRVPILGDMLHGCGSMITALGVATIVVGFMLGTVFGINIMEAGWIPQTTTLGKIMAWLQGNVPGTNYSIQMAGAIAIGVFHICLAMVVKALLYTKKEGFKSQISTWGWVLLLVGSVVSGILMLMGALTQDQFVAAIIVIGAVAALAIYFLNNVGRLAKSPLKGLLINPLAGLYDTYNMASGLLGDVLSYIRIYALCLAGGMLGGAFNMIGDMVWAKGGGGIFFAIIIYIVGHLFNLLMSAISAFVHPLRLNFVEYFKNSGYEGKGTGYKPFELK